MYRVLNGMLIEVSQTTIVLEKTTEILASPVVSVDSNTRTLNILYNEGHTNSQLPYEVIEDLPLTIEGTFFTLSNKITINGFRYYSKGDLSSEYSLTQLLVGNDFGPSRVEARNTSIFILLTEDDLASFSWNDYSSLVNDSDWVYVKLIEEGLARFANFNFIELKGTRNITPTSSRIYKEGRKANLDEARATAEFIRYLGSNFDYSFSGKNHRELTENEFILFKARQADASQDLHLVRGPNYVRMRYAHIMVDFQYCTADVRKLMNFRGEYLNNRGFPQHTSFPINIDSLGEEGTVQCGVFWGRDDISDDVFENTPVSSTEITLHTFNFQAILTAPLIEGTDEPLLSIQTIIYGGLHAN